MLTLFCFVAAVAGANWASPPSGLVGWWPGEGDARDIVGTNHGILQGGAGADSPAMVGTGFTFDGTNKYVEIANAPELNPKQLSVECWVRFDNLDAPGTSVYVGQQYLVFKQNSRSTDFEGYVLSKDRTHADIILWEVTSARGKLVRIDSVSAVTTNEWYHLVGVRGPDYIRLYFNGKLEAQAAVDFPQDYGDHPLYFGTSGQPYYDRRLNGVLDEVSLYKRALSSAEVAGLYAAGSAGKGRLARVTINGKGSVSPNYNQRALKSGVMYQMTAHPGAGYVFSNWTGAVFTTNRTVHFLGQSGLVLEANFVPNPFIPVAGTYRGLFYEDRPVHATSGVLRLQLSPRGAFSGATRLAGVHHAFTGRFDLEGRAVVPIAQGSSNSATLDLSLDLRIGLLGGTVLGQDWTAELEADRQVYDPIAHPCPARGRYTMVIPGVEASTQAPEGAGIAVVRVSRSGLVTATARLADGIPFTTSSALSQSDQWPFFVPLYRQQGSLFGWLELEDLTDSDFSGLLTWSRPEIVNAHYYPAGFVVESTCIGSRYHPPAAGQRILDFTEGKLTLTGGGRIDPLTALFELNTANQVSSTNHLALHFNLNTGSFHGTARDSAQSTRQAFTGVVLQKPGFGAGAFRSTNFSGAVLLQGTGL